MSKFATFFSNGCQKRSDDIWTIDGKNILDSKVIVIFFIGSAEAGIACFPIVGNTTGIYQIKWVQDTI